MLSSSTRLGVMTLAAAFAVVSCTADTGGLVVIGSADGGETADAHVVVDPCADGVRNGSETDVDCGGACKPCLNGRGCTTAADCASGICRGELCVHSPRSFDGPYYYYLDVASREAAGGLAVGDVTGDGLPDVVVSGRTDVVVFAQNASGTLGPAVRYPVSSWGVGPIALGDADGDGRLDVFLYLADRLGVLLQLEGGGLTPNLIFRITDRAGNPNPRSIAIGDLDGDGRDDVVLASPGRGLLTLSSLGVPPQVAFGDLALNLVEGEPWSVVLEDVNGDGRRDVVLGVRQPPSRPQPSALLVFAQTTSGTLAEPQQYEGTNGMSVAAGDVNGDGRADVVVSAPNGVGVLLQNESGTLGPMTFLASAHESFTNTDQVALGDLDGDGLVDIAAIDSGVQASGVEIYFQEPGGSFAAPMPVAIEHYGMDALAIADVNNDGLRDIIVMNGLSYGPSPPAFGVLLQRP